MNFLHGKITNFSNTSIHVNIGDGVEIGMGQVFKLAAAETALIDAESIRVLRHSLGNDKCAEILDDSLFQIADRLSLLERSLKSEDLPEIYRYCLGLVGTAEQIGMIGVSYVARDLMNCVKIGNMTAIHAVAARLIRIGEDSLFSARVLEGTIGD